MNLENLKTTDLVGQWDLNLPVQTTSSQQGRVECIGTVGSHDNLGLAEIVESIQLVKKFHQCSLNFSVCRGTLGESSTTDSVDFVHEDDTGLVFFGVTEHFSY